MIFFLFINVKMSTIVGFLIFVNWKNFMLKAELSMKKMFYNLGARVPFFCMNDVI